MARVRRCTCVAHIIIIIIIVVVGGGVVGESEAVHLRHTRACTTHEQSSSGTHFSEQMRGGYSV